MTVPEINKYKQINTHTNDVGKKKMQVKVSDKDAIALQPLIAKVLVINTKGVKSVINKPICYQKSYERINAFEIYLYV